MINFTRPFPDKVRWFMSGRQRTNAARKKVQKRRPSIFQPVKSPTKRKRHEAAISISSDEIIRNRWGVGAAAVVGCVRAVTIALIALRRPDPRSDVVRRCHERRRTLNGRNSPAFNRNPRKLRAINSRRSRKAITVPEFAKGKTPALRF